MLTVLKMTDAKILRFADAVGTAAADGTLRTLVLYSPTDRSGELRKIKGVPRTIGGHRVIQMESSLTEGRLAHRNVPTGGIAEYFLQEFENFRRADLMSSEGDMSLMMSKKGDRVTLLSHTASDTSRPDPGAGNDRVKRRLLTGEEAFLRELGVSDERGRVRDKMMPKFRQINRFCEYVSEAAERLGGAGVLYIADLCCGKSYLSFAAYHTVTEIIGRPCEMYCVDLKESVIEYCSAAATACGYVGMHFACCDVAKYVPEHAPDMVISLHACDTATDAVIDFAVRYGARAILATPCCHREMSEHISCSELDFISRRPILRQKLCSAATDALRLLRLEACGYETDATELIDPESTPKNVMLRGYLRQDRREVARRRAAAEYAAAYRFIYGSDPEEI